MVDMCLFPRGLPDKKDTANISPNATWLSPDIVKTADHWRFDQGKIFLGAVENTLIGVKDNRHIMTVAGSRSGKGTSAIIPNLLSYQGSVLVIDPKGENASITAEQRKKMGQKVHVLDPFGTSGIATSAFNPLDLVDMDSESCVDDASLISDALIVDEGGDNKHFSSAAKNWIRGLILHICDSEPEESRNLLKLREFLTIDGETLSGLIEEMAVSDAGYGIVARAARSLNQKSDREFSSVLSTAVEQTDFLDSPAMRHVLNRSDFDIFDLKQDKLSVYLCLPAGRMATHNRWFRIFINLVMETLERRPAPPEHPVLIIMDEFPILGHMESIEKASGLVAGFGVKLWTIIQDLSQLKRHYPKTWETFMGNAGVLQFFGNSDLTTLRYISERLGQSTVINVSQGEISEQQAAHGFSGKSFSTTLVPLMNSDEIARHFSRQSGNQIIFWPGSNPIAIDRVEYYKHPIFKNKYQTRSY